MTKKSKGRDGKAPALKLKVEGDAHAVDVLDQENAEPAMALPMDG